MSNPTPDIQASLERSKFNRFTRYSISVAAALVLLVGLYMAYNYLTLSPEKVVASKYQVYELSNTPSKDTTKVELEKSFRAKDYEKVLQNLSVVRDSSAISLFLGGIASLEMKNPSRAVALLSKVLEKNRLSKNPEWKEETEYYLALGYISNRDYDLALPLLKKIHGDPKHLYHDKVSRKFMRRVRMLKWK